jgi:tetratricopeptide (TPR) repeat protein
MPTAKGIRWILLMAWVILAINNVGKVPFYLGMDIGGHIEYIRFVSEKMKIPLATDGWQMFQPPLFYLLSAIIYKFCLTFFSLETVFGMLRILPLLCGIAQVELCYRALRYVYPEREDLQALGTVIGGLLPMNIYISQVVGNEPLAGFLTGVVMVLALRFLSFSSLRSKGYFFLVGLVLGLALLTKMSAIAAIPSLVFFTGYKIYLNRGSAKRPTLVVVERISLVLGVAFLVSGWYCIRNYVEFGKVIIGGWDPITGFGWWQDPAYRTVQQFLSFGEALFYPVNSAIMGVWDSLYSTTWTDAAMSGHTAGPPWNYEFLFSSVWLSLLPCAAIFLGVLKAFKKPSTGYRQASVFAASCTIVYIFAILYMFLTLPIYTTGKATYALGLTPCLAVLCAAGFESLMRKVILRAAIYGIVACWAVNAYFAFFVVHSPDPAKNSWFLGKFSASHGRIAEAIEHYTEALQIDPGHLDAHNYLGCALVSQGKIDEAIVHFKKALNINPDFEDAYIYLGNALLLQGRAVEAMELFKKALQVNPNSEEAYTYMGNALVAHGKVDEAINYYKRALETRPDNTINALLSQGKIDEAMNYNTKALGTGIGPATIVDGIFKRPHFERVHLNLGNAYVAQVKHDQAIVHYKKALRINPDFKEAHNSFGNALAAQGQHREAIEHYNKALGVDPEYVDVYNNLGNALAGQGRISEAIEYYRQALRLDPGFNRAHLRLGNALVRQGKTSEGIEHYLVALGQDPDFERAHLDLGDALVSQGRHEEGIGHYKEALRLNRDFMEAYNSLGDVLAAQGKLTEAIEHYSEALRINPGFVEVHDKMGKALVRKGEMDKAIVHFREALSIRPDHVSAQKGLKKALRIQREIEKDTSKTK